MLQNSISLVPFCSLGLCHWWSSALTPGCCTAQSSAAGELPSDAGAPSADTPPPPATPRFWSVEGEELPFPQKASALEFQSLEKKEKEKENSSCCFVGTRSVHVVGLLHTSSIASLKY